MLNCFVYLELDFGIYFGRDQRKPVFVFFWPDHAQKSLVSYRDRLEN